VVLLLLCCGIQLSPQLAEARPAVGWGRLDSSVELGYEQERQKTTQKNAPSGNFDSNRFRERLRLRNKRLYVLDPRLVTLNLEAGLEFFQENNNFSGQDGSQDGRLLDYAVDSTFFPQKPYSLLLYAQRTQNRVSRNFGTRTDVKTTGYGGRTDLHEDSILKDKGIPYFSAALAANRLNVEETSSGNGQNFDRSEAHDIVQFDAHKGYQTADLTLHYKFDDDKDNLRPDNGFTTHTANLNYGLDFGPTLNRSWTSLINYIRRIGLNDNNSLTVNENLLIEHNAELVSSYQYGFNRFNTSGGATTTHTASANISRSLYHSLTSSLQVQGSQVNLPEGKTKSYGGGPSFNYVRNLPAKGHLTLRANGTYRIEDNALNSGSIDVQNEAHQVGATFPVGDPGFQLNNRRVVVSTIVVIDRRSGGQLSTTAGVDYEVIAEGDKTRIRPLPTSVILQTGDPLEVGYTFQVAPSVRFSTTLIGLGGGIDFGWISFTAAHDVSNQKRLSGADNGFLQDRTIDTVDLRLRGRWQRLLAEANAGFQREDSTNDKYKRWHFGQSGSYTGIFGMRLTVNATESFTSFNDPRSRQSNDFAANMELNGVIGRGWLTRAFASILLLKDTDVDDQTTGRAGIDVKRHIGKLTLSGDLVWSDFDNGPTNTTDRRIDVHVIRRF